MVAGLTDDHKLLRIADWQEPQHNLVKQTEHRSIRAYSERQRGHRNQGERKIPSERSNTVPKILDEPLQPDSHANIANALFNLLNPSHIPTSIAAGLLGRHSFPHLFGRYQFQIGLEFFIEVAIKLFSAEQILPESAESTSHRASLCRAQSRRHGERYSFPPLRLGTQMLFAGLGQRVE